jgi:hypothetical protein
MLTVTACEDKDARDNSRQDGKNSACDLPQSQRRDPGGDIGGLVAGKLAAGRLGARQKPNRLPRIEGKSFQT